MCLHVVAMDRYQTYPSQMIQVVEIPGQRRVTLCLILLFGLKVRPATDLPAFYLLCNTYLQGEAFL